MVIWQRAVIVAVSAVMIGTACSGGERVATSVGPFKITRTQHAYTNWSTGSRNTYFNYDVRYRRREFKFPGFTYSGSGLDAPTSFDSSQIAAAFVVAQSPAALLVLAGDPNNDASWILLVDTPAGLRAEHVAFQSTPSELAWLDGATPVSLEGWRDRLMLDGGKWLWVDRQAMVDVQALQVYRLDAPRGSRDGAQFVAFSPDRQRVARFGVYLDTEDYRIAHPVIIENTIATGKQRLFDIDTSTMWFDDNRDVDQRWLEAYFEWWPGRDGYTLQRRATPQDRPYHGRLELEPYAKALQYQVPRIRFEHRVSVMEHLASAVGGTFEFDAPIAEAPPPPAAAAASADFAPADAAVAAPPVSGPLVRAVVKKGDKALVVYFSDSGLSIANNDRSLNEWVQTIATSLDAALATPAGRAWITAAHTTP